MKKITLLFLCLVAFTFSNAQNGGDTCGAAVAITPGSFTATLITQDTAGGEQGTTQPRDAAWFSYTPTSDGTITVSACLGGADTRLHIGTGTCGALTTLETNDDECPFMGDGTGDAYASEIVDLPVTSGTTYYIEWDDRWSMDAFDWSLTFNAPPACDVPDAITLDFLSDTFVDVSWSEPIFGTPTAYEWEVVTAGAGQGGGGGPTGSTTAPTMNDSATGLTAATDYDFYIRTDCGGTFSDWAGPVSFTTTALPPPANDVCTGAVTATQETGVADAASANAIAATLENAVNTNLAATVCNGFTGTANDDVWYSFEALTTSVNITVEPTAFDAVIVLYSGTCGALTELDCADAGNPEEINATGLSIGETYYFRVYDWFTALAADPTFSYKLWSPETLSNVTFENDNTFKLFPNPVKEELSIRAQNTIENVSVFNMLGQEVLRSSPNAISTDLNMSGLQTGTYFARVTINNVTETVKIFKR